jgi:hypothetical protein
MAGLLDNFNDPQTMGLLNAGLNMLGNSGASRNPMNLGQILGGGLQTYTGIQDEFRRRKQQEEENAYTQQMRDFKMNELKQGIADREASQQFQSQLPNIIAQYGGDTKAMARDLRIPQEVIKRFEESRNYGKNKVARTIEVEGEGGTKMTRQLDDYGNQTVEDVNAYVAPVSTNLGDRIVMNKPMAGQSFPIGRSPDSVASQNVTMRGQNMTDARMREALEFNKQKNAQVDGYSTKPLPTAALKMQNEAVDAIGAASGVTKMLNGVENKIKEGKIKFGPISNLANRGLNFSGYSTEESRNFASFQADLEKIRNESLRLNNGVQTEGDSVRAWNELFNNINDTDLVKQRLGEIRSLNNRAVDLQKLKIDGIRGNYQAEPYNFEKLLGAGSGQPPKDKKWNDFYSTEADAIKDARNALMKNPSAKSEIIKRLESSGITNHGLK